MSPKILNALTPLLEALEKLEIRYQVGGSLASSVHGVPRSSLDIDILISMEPKQADELVRNLEDSFYISRPRVVEAVERGKSFNVIHLQTMIKVDVFIARTDLFRRQSLTRRRPETLVDETRSASVYVTSAEDIVLHKLEWFRKGGETSERQWLDVLGVLRIQGDSLDATYLSKWASELGVADLLESALHEADLEAE